MAFSLKRAPKDAQVETPAGAPRRIRPVKTGKARRGRRFVLIIGDEGAILIFMQGNKVVRRLFAPSAQASHSEAMIDIMRQNPGVSLSILADVIDQQYVPQTFPPVSQLSVGGLVKRRLDRDFQAEDLKGSILLGRDKEGRKEWKYLLIALAKTPLISEWIDLLVELPNELKGIYLVPVEASNYVGMLAKMRGEVNARPWQLLISHNKVSCFRQVVMQNGKLIFTRVSQAIDDAIPAVIAGNVEQEIINTIEYLKRLGFTENSDLDATIIISQDVIETLDLNRFGFGHAEALTPIAVAERLGLEQAALSADRFGDVVMAAAFGSTRKRILRFSTAYIDKLSILYLAQIGIKVAVVLVALVMLFMVGSTAADIIEDYYAISDTDYKAQQQKPELAKTQAAVSGLNHDVAFKSAVVATYDAYIKDVLKPEDFVADFAPFNTLQHRVVNFEWELTSAGGKPGAAPASPPTPGASGALPLHVKLDIDFGGAGSTLDVVDKNATELMDTMKARLPQYDISADAFPWQKEEAHSEEVAVEVNSPSSVVVNNAVGSVNFKGLKTVTPTPAAATPAAAPAPGGIGSVGMPGGQP